MKTLGTIIAAFVLMIALVPTGLSATSSGERNTASACITYIQTGFGCATGKIGSLPPVNCGNGCDVTITADLWVTPIACGWLEQGNLQACAIDKPEHPPTDAKTNRFAPGTYTVKSDLCVTDPTVTYTFPCEELRHTFIVPGTSNNFQNNAAIIIAGVFSILPDVPGGEDPGEDRLVYQSPTFRVYQHAA